MAYKKWKITLKTYGNDKKRTTKKRVNKKKYLKRK